MRTTEKNKDVSNKTLTLASHMLISMKGIMATVLDKALRVPTITSDNAPLTTPIARHECLSWQRIDVRLGAHFVPVQ